MKWIYFVASAIIATTLFILASYVWGHHMIQGDFDRDGDVDFSDFTVFAQNFSKYWNREQGMTFVKHEVFRDTLVIHDQFGTEAGKRAARMLGFWYLNYEYRYNNKIYEYDRVFIFNRIDPEPNADGEYTVHGRNQSSENIDVAISVGRVTVKYDKNTQRYVLKDDGGLYVAHSYDLFDLECTFHFEDKIHQDMWDRLNRANYRGNYPFLLPEPTAQVESIVAITKVPTGSNRRTEVMPFVLTPINDGLRRASRYEFMAKTTNFRIRTE